jgi:hypothetical protein
VDPVGSLTIIIAFLLPASEVVAENWLMRLLTALETEGVATFTDDRLQISIGA